MSRDTKGRRPVKRGERITKQHGATLSTPRAEQRVPDTATATATNTTDIAVFRRELVDGTRAMLGVEIASSDTKR